MKESDPDAFTSLIDLLQQFKTFAVGVVALGVYRGIRMWLNNLGDKDSKADRQDKAETKDWLSQQDRRFRDVVDRTNADNVRLLERNGKLEGEMMAKDAEIDRERKSGMHHYQVSVDIYQYAQGLVHDWRNGQNPPDKMKKFEEF
jgi:hypothetical protein